MWHPSQSDLLHVHVKDAAMPSKKLSGAFRRSPRDGAACGDQNLDVYPCVESSLMNLLQLLMEIPSGMMRVGVYLLQGRYLLSLNDRLCNGA